VENYHPEFAY